MNDLTMDKRPEELDKNNVPAKSNKWKVGASVSILLAQKNESGFLKTEKRIIGFVDSVVNPQGFPGPVGSSQSFHQGGTIHKPGCWFFNDEKMDKENEAGERAGWRKSAGALMARDLRFGL
jgi:hypothetical protein